MSNIRTPIVVVGPHHDVAPIGVWLSNVAAITATPRVLLHPTQDTGKLADGNSVLCRTELQIPIEGIAQAMLDDPDLHVRLELLLWRRARQVRKHDDTRGLRKIRIPAGFRHPTNIYNPTNIGGTRGGDYADLTSSVATEWPITGQPLHSKIRVPLVQLSRWFRGGNVYDLADNAISSVISTDAYRPTNRGRYGISRGATKRAFAFRWVFVLGGQVIEGPTLAVVWVGHPISPSMPTGANAFMVSAAAVAAPEVANTRHNNQYELAASMSPLMRLAVAG